MRSLLFFVLIYLSLSLFFSLSPAHELEFSLIFQSITKKQKKRQQRAYEVCTHNIAAVSNCSSGSSLSRRPSASVGTQWEEGEAAAAAAAAAGTSTATYKQQQQKQQHAAGNAVAAGAAAAAAGGRRGGGGGGVGGVGKKKQPQKKTTTTKS